MRSYLKNYTMIDSNIIRKLEKPFCLTKLAKLLHGKNPKLYQ